MKRNDTKKRIRLARRRELIAFSYDLASKLLDTDCDNAEECGPDGCSFAESEFCREYIRDTIAPAIKRMAGPFLKEAPRAHR